MPLFQKKEESIIGVDLGSRAIKLVQLTKYKGKPKLITYGIQIRDKSSEIGNQKEFLADNLKNLIARSRATATTAVSALPATSVFNTIITLPKIPEKEISSAIHWEAKKLIPLPIEKMSLNWHILPDKNKTQTSSQNQKSAEEEKIRILLNAAPKNLTMDYISIFRKAELKLISLETEIKALQRSLLTPKQPPTLIIDIGSTNTNLIVFNNGLPLINRNMEIGGESINIAIANTMNISAERAEQLKNEFGLPTNQTNIHPASRAIKFSVDNVIIQEIRRIRAMLTNTGQPDVQIAILSGGGSHIANMPAYLEKTLEIPLSIANPWEKISFPSGLKPELDKFGPELAVSVGLALKKF